MKFKPAPGTYIVEEIKNESPIDIPLSSKRIQKGKVVAVGPIDLTDYGINIPMPVQVGDIAYFLSYEGQFDEVTIKGKKYYTVLRRDHRFCEN